MLNTTVSFLLDLNRQFYQQFGAAFAATRQRIQPGVARLLGQVPLEGRWLDIGCGNGELSRDLRRRGFTGQYVGLDFSKEMLEAASAILHPPAPSPSHEERAGGEVAPYQFRLADLSNPLWPDPFPPASFDIALAFAVLHHLPDADLRRQTLARLRRLLPPGALFFHSEWQFHNSPRLLARILPWETVGLSAGDVDEGDCLLDWRYALPGQVEQTGLRYVHRFDLPELAQLAAGSGFEIVETFESDGQGGRLGLYQAWRAA